MEIAKNSLFYQKFISSVIVGFTSWGILTNNRAIAETPKIFTDSTILPVNFDECKQRAITAANSILKDITIAEERNLRFKVTGTRKNTVAVVYCIERYQGTIAIITTSTYGKQYEKEAYFIYNQLTQLVSN